jgi:hypothetical protein
MYRYNIDEAVTYSPDDIVLFRESPFAAWMERLTLENPDHGILPDTQSTTPSDKALRPDAIVATLRAEGRNVALIDGELPEADRQTATLGAMRSGADFIVNGQLAVAPLSGCVKLLMRTSGCSDLGDFLYIPCETQAESSLNSAFRLAFFADLLHGLQGQLPPQMLIIRDGAEVVPLQTEDSIYYYRAVLQRFMKAMEGFRKHRMPDPSESSHFGRWSACASEVLKQRAQSEQTSAEESQLAEQAEEVLEIPQLRVASGHASSHSQYDAPDRVRPDAGQANNSGGVSVAPRSEAGHTLAEQAQQLAPGSFRYGAAPGHTPNLARFSYPRSVENTPYNQDKGPYRHSSDAMLQNLEFIGSRAPQAPLSKETPKGAQKAPSDVLQEEPPAALQKESPVVPQEATKTAAQKASSQVYDDEDDVHAPSSSLRDYKSFDQEPAVGSARSLADLEPRPPFFLPPDQLATAPSGSERRNPYSCENSAAEFDTDPVIDMDGVPAPTLPPLEEIEEPEFGPVFSASLRPPNRTPAKAPSDDHDGLAANRFSSSLHTSEELDKY